DVTVNGSVGRVASNGSVALGTFGAVNGDVFASQNLTLGAASNIHGNAVYGNTLSVGTFAKIDGTTTKAPNSTAVDHFAPVSIATAATDTSLASRVFLESHGNIHIGWDNLGTLYAPLGDISLDSLTNVYGGVYAGHDAIFGGGANVYYIPTGVAGTAVPEPT